MFDDIVIHPTFIKDYESLPKDIQKRVDRRIHDWAIVGRLPPSAQSHRAWNYQDDIWICYLSKNHGAYRMLVEVKDRKLMMHRVGDHDLMERELRANS